MKISQELVSQLLEVIPDLNELIMNDDLSEIETVLDQAIVNALDKDYNATPESRRLQKLYDELYAQNEPMN